MAGLVLICMKHNIWACLSPNHTMCKLLRQQSRAASLPLVLAGAVEGIYSQDRRALPTSCAKYVHALSSLSLKLTMQKQLSFTMKSTSPTSRMEGRLACRSINSPMRLMKAWQLVKRRLQSESRRTGTISLSLRDKSFSIIWPRP